MLIATDSFHIQALSSRDAWANYSAALNLAQSETETREVLRWTAIAHASLWQYFLHIDNHPSMIPYRQSTAGDYLDVRKHDQ